MFDSADVFIGQWIDTTKVVADTTINNERWFLIVTKFDVSAVVYPARNTPTGYCQFDRRPLIHSSVLNFKYPTKSGEVFTINFEFKDSIWTFQRTITTTDTNIVVPAGIYSCLLYYNPRKSLDSFAEVGEHEFFIGVGTGIVRENYFRTAFSGRRYLWAQSELTKTLFQ